MKWLAENWPSVVIGLTTGFIYVYAWMRLNSYLLRMEATEKELVKQKHEWLMLKSKVNKIILVHCKKHQDDLEALLKEKEPEEGA